MLTGNFGASFRPLTGLEFPLEAVQTVPAAFFDALNVQTSVRVTDEADGARGLHVYLIILPSLQQDWMGVLNANRVFENRELSTFFPATVRSSTIFALWHESAISLP